MAGDRIHYGGGQIAGVKRCGAVFGQLLERVRIGGILQQVSGGKCNAVGKKIGSRGLLSVKTASLARQKRGQTRGHREAFVGEADGAVDGFRQTELAVPFAEQFQQERDAGHADGPAADDGLEEGQRLAIVVQEQIRSGGQGRGFARVIGGERGAGGIIPKRERAAAKSR